MENKYMNKNQNKATKETKEIFNFIELDFNKLDDIIRRAEQTEYKRGLSVIRYPLCGGVTLSIYDTDRDYDYGTLNVYGVSVNITIRPSKNGMFLSYPSVKTKSGEYSNQVNNFSKAFNDIIKKVLEKHYVEV